MTIDLDPQTEQLIQHEIDLGRFSEPAEVVKQAIEFLHGEEEWTSEDKGVLHHRLTESLAQIARGEGIPGDQLAEHLTVMRQSR